MNAQQLKNSILQDAIMGKLVPQDPNDEPASVLLDKIRKEKARLVKEGKLKKKDLKETSISKDEIPFEIPEGWEWCRIKDLFETSSGSTPQSKNPKYYSNGSINWVRTTDLNNGILDSSEIKITKEAVADYNLSIIPQNSVCIAMYGGGGTIGKHSIIKFDTTINQSVCAIFPNGYCDMNYVHIFVQFQRPKWMDFAAGSRKDPNINQIIIKNCLFPLPPLAEQLRIVAKIEELLPKVEEYGKAQEALDKLNAEMPERLKKSILQEAIMGRLVPQDPNDEPASLLLDKIRKEKARLVKEGKLKKKDLIETPISEEEKPFEIPESWEWVRINDLGEVITGGTPSKQHKEYYGDDYPFYKPGDLDKGINVSSSVDGLSRKGFEASRKLKAYSILVTCIGATIGKTGLISKEGACNQQINAIIPVNSLYSKYIYYALCSPSLQSIIRKDAGQTTLPIMNKNNFCKLLFPLPPLAEQHRIVAKIEELLTKIDKLNTK